MAEENSDADLARRLLAEWDQGRGTTKSRIEIREWGDATAHGRRFDRFVERTLGVSTSKRSRQSSQIEMLETQVRRLGAVPVTTSDPPEWTSQLVHARNSALAALRVWNDPTATFRTETFALLFATAWNGLALAILQQAGKEWRVAHSNGGFVLINGRERAREILDVVSDALPGNGDRGIRENIRYWVELRNQVAHRHLPALDAVVIPYAQAGLLSFENVLVTQFGRDYQLGTSLSVPLQLSGFRDPGVLASLKELQASLPLDVQEFLSRIGSETEELMSDPNYVLRVAFVPVLPNSGNNPDAVAYFVRPGEVSPEMEVAIEKYVVLQKIVRPERPNLIATQVVNAVSARINYRFTVNMHTAATYSLGARFRDDLDRCDPSYCEYVSSVKRHLYNQAWVDRLVRELSDEIRFQEVTATRPVDATTKQSSSDHLS